jgi:hypothetical protein
LDWQPVHRRSGLVVDAQMGEQSNAAFDPFCGGKPPLSGRQRILWMRERLGEGLGNDDGAPPQSPMSLLAVAALQGDSPAFALVMVADGQHQRIDAIVVGAEQAHFPATEAVEQPPEGPLVTAAALPVNQPSGRAVIGFPDPNFVVLARQQVPHFIEFDHHRLAGRRLNAATTDIAADTAQHRLRCGAEQIGQGVERQAVAVQIDGGASGRFGRAVPFKVSELVEALPAAPSLLACDDAVSDQAATAAPGTAKRSGNHQNAKL